MHSIKELTSQAEVLKNFLVEVLPKVPEKLGVTNLTDHVIDVGGAQHLSKLRFAYNTACHSSLGTSPALLNFGRNPLPINSLRKQAVGEPEIETREPDQWAERMSKVQVM